MVLIGSAGKNSANDMLVKRLSEICSNDLEFELYQDLRSLPHFDTALTLNDPPSSVQELRARIAGADGILICSPEYIFSIPSGLKNVFEWCVSTTVFLDKPCGLITASAQGEKAHAELMLIMRTLMAKFEDKTTLLISGIKGKINANGEIKDAGTEKALLDFADAFRAHVLKC